MSSKIEVSREALLAAANRLSDMGQAKFSAPLWEALAAPVVERQSLPIYQVRYLGDGGAGWSDVEKDELDQLKSRKDYHTRTVFDAPPELAELQSTIDRLTAENERNAKNAKEWEEASLHWMAERDQFKSEIERLKGGQGEPFGWWRIPEGCPLQGMFLPWVGPESERDIQNAKDFGFTVILLYTSQPAPVSSELVQLLERAKVYARGPFLDEINACLDKVKELNT